MLSMKRIALAAAVAVAAFAVPAAPLSAQTPDRSRVQDQAYEKRRKELLDEVQAAQKRLAEIRGDRVNLQARIEAYIAQLLKNRSEALLMANETAALMGLDSVLTQSENNLLAQRDRFLAISDAVRRRTGAVLVVLMRADSSSGAQSLSGANLSIDNAQLQTRTYTGESNRALALGAVDQLYRASVLPTSHTVMLQVNVNGGTQSSSANVTVASESVTYVQFAVRNGQLTYTTWTSKGTTPF
ncbi:MAG TPA: hypothetical protein VKA84_14905 [Gemmatimonadaceae bacterium]|nr:hypothetical protein [Gemmatimonadaceae bacterium]